jgi:hypothetical protein
MGARIDDTYRSGEIIVSFRHMDPFDPTNDKSKRKEPCMVLRNRMWEKRDDEPAICIPLDEAYRFAESREVYPRSFEYCRVLYGITHRSGCFHICDAILGAIGELVMMPPPPGLSRLEWENELDRAGIEVKLDGQVIAG